MNVVGILSIIVLVECFVATALLMKNVDAVKCTFFSFVHFIGLFCITSGILFAFDLFSLRAALIFQMIIVTVFLFILIYRSKIDLHWRTDWKKYLFLTIAIVFLMPTVQRKFEFYGMGQDEGVYQTKAIELINGNNENQVQFSEYDDLGAEEKNEFIDFQKMYLAGFYLYDEELPTLKAGDKLHDTSGFYHGFPTFPAILGMVGKIFGIDHMADIQTIFYICSIFLLFFLLELLQINYKLTNILTVCYAMAPVLIWVSKSTLTEMFLVCIMMSFFYYILSRSTKWEIWMSVFFIAVFSLYHISVYTMMPLFILLYFVCFFYSKDKTYLLANILAALFFMFGVYAMTRVSATYAFTYNLKPLYIDGLIDQNNIVSIIYTVCTGVIIVNCLLCVVAGKLKDLHTICPRLSCIWRWANQLGVICLLVYSAYRIISRVQWSEAILFQVNHTTLIGFMLMSGLILLPAIIVFFLFKTQVCLSELNGCLCMLGVIYCVLIYSFVMKGDIPHYYYYGRYIVPYVFIIIITAAKFMEYWKTKWSVCGVIGVTITFSIIVFIKYGNLLRDEQDDTLFLWENFKEITTYCEDADIILMDKNIAMKLYLPLRAMTGVPVFPVNDWLVEDYVEEEKNIYYLTDNVGEIIGWKNIYRENYIMSENLNTKIGSVIPYPLEISKESGYISIYLQDKTQYQYSITDANLEKEGYYYSQGEKQWTNPVYNKMTCYLEQRNYRFELVQGDIIPVEFLPGEKMEVKLIINGYMVSTYILTAHNALDNIVIDIPKEFINSGNNIVSIICDGWCPADYGSNDNRLLGISIKALNFY